MSEAGRTLLGMSDSTETSPDNPNGPDARESFEQNEQIVPEPAADDVEMLGGSGPDASSASKDPEDWVTGDEPMTGPQKSYLDTLLREAGEELPANLTKAEASEHIDRLQKLTGRGQ